MGGEQAANGGPDLGSGVALAELPEGEPFAGQFAGEPVILVRRGSEVRAIGAVCTHYGGPLAEGLVVGDTVRCPWHHARFSLRTGEAVGAPALNPVLRYGIEVRDGTVYLLDKEESPPLATFGRRVEGPESIVIIGGGAAGSAAAEMLRREGFERPVTVIDPDAEAPYDRPNLSKDYLAGDAPEEWLPLRPPGFYAEHGIDRVTVSAQSIDLRARRVRLADGRDLPFGALLLATGAVPVRLPTPGADLPHVKVLRSLADCRAIIASIEEARRAVVVGASFIGMEVAASLRSRGLDVIVVAPESVPFERTLGAEVGGLLRQTHERHGVEFRLGRTLARIHAREVVLDDQSTVPADLVVMGVGVKPDTRLAEAAGLRVDNGVLVDERLETSSPGVFAAGDIARYPDPATGERIRVEHWVAAQRQGQSAARNLLGHDRRFVDPPFFWTRQWEFGLNYVGYAARWDEVRIDGDLGAGDATVEYIRGGATRAVATVGRDLESLEKEATMETGAAGRG
jgi:NADPH-dependent 2,4-dienoyl-CoA reductase/sulfur reductase-like enzyme/nitrite reductase/ring-hydroxylating ferredoxin subunit